MINKDLLSEFGLPSYVKGKTFAEASKKIDSKFKDRNDMVSLKTKEDMLQRLADAQEYIKQVEQADAATNDFFAGGAVATQTAGIATGAGPTAPLLTDAAQLGASNPNATAGGQGGGGMVPDLGKALESGSSLISNVTKRPDVNMEGNTYIENKASVGGGALSGAQQGMEFAEGTGLDKLPGGKLITAGVGAVLGGIGGHKKRKAQEEANSTFMGGVNNEMRNDFFGGGFAENVGSTMHNLKNKTRFLKTEDFNPEAEEDKINWLEKTGQALSFAPVAGNLIQGSKLRKPTTPAAPRLDSTYERSLSDRSGHINKISEANVTGALRDASGGDVGALRSSLLAADLNKKKAVSDAMMKSDQMDAQDTQAKNMYDMRKGMINMQSYNQYLERKAQDEAAYNSTKANFEGAMYDNLGAIGKEMVDKETVKRMFGYKWNGEYFVDDKGNKLSPQEMAQYSQMMKKQNESMYGGYLKKKK